MLKMLVLSITIKTVFGQTNYMVLKDMKAPKVPK